MPVYLIRAGDSGPVKIGHARSVASRLAGFQTGNHEKLTLLRTWPGAQPEEARLHRHFADLRTVGEWFRFSPEMLTIEVADIPVAPRPEAEGERHPRNGVEAIIKGLGGIAAAARLLNASRPAVYDWIADNAFPGHRLPALLGLGLSPDALMPLVAHRKRSAGGAA